MMPLECDVDLMLDSIRGQDVRSGMPEGCTLEYLTSVQDAETFHYMKFIRGVFVIRAATSKSAAKMFYRLIDCAPASEDGKEPMFNLLSWYSAGEFRSAVIFRGLHRPHCYFAENDDRMMISPGCADMAGIVVTPRREDFDRLTQETLSGIYDEVSMSADAERTLLWRLTREQRMLSVGIMSAREIVFEIISDGAGPRSAVLSGGKIEYDGMLYDELYFDYTRFYALAVLARPQARDILMLGGGGGSVPKWLLSGKSGLDAADLRLTVVELDPGMSAVARRWFFLPGDDPRLRLIHADARTFLNRQREQYDILLVDVFNSCYSIPFHLGTQEAFAAMRRALRPGGVLAMNVIAAVEGEDGRLLRAIHAGLQRHFARVEVFCVTDPGHPGQLQNLMVLAFSDAATAAALRDGPGHSPEMAAMLACRYRPSLPVTEPLRDDFAPVERFALSLLRRP